MGLLRAIIIYIIGSFLIYITKEGEEQMQKLPILGSELQKMLKNQKEKVIVILLAISQLFI